MKQHPQRARSGLVPLPALGQGWELGGAGQAFRRRLCLLSAIVRCEGSSVYPKAGAFKLILSANT